MLWTYGNRPVSSVTKHITSGAGGQGFDSRAGQIGHSVFLSYTFLRSCIAQALSHGDAPATRHTLRRKTPSVMKI